MAKNPSVILFTPCAFAAIQPAVAARLRQKQVLVESYWEDHVLASHCYQMLDAGQPMGYFAVHGGTMLTLFHVNPGYDALSQALFARAKRYENVSMAQVASGDEFFLCHCLDDFSRLEKQGYFARYGPAPAAKQQDAARPIQLRKASFPADTSTFALCQGFLDEDIQRAQEGFPPLTLYIAEREGDVAGFGVLQTGQILPEIASIGMYVCEEYRRQGVATAILGQLRQMVEQQGLTPVSGCWYYNHNSKKSQEAAGACCFSRLLRFHF